MKINVIWGPPASGKSTFVNENKTDNDLIFDFDLLMKDLSGLDIYKRNDNLISYLIDIRQSIIDKLESESKLDNAWIIISYPKGDFKKQLEDMKANFILMETSKEECKKRIDDDEQRQDKDLWKNLVDKWFGKYDEKKGVRMMKIELRNNEAIIEGYVNAVERDSKVLPPSMARHAKGNFVEKVMSKTFQRAIEHNDNVELMFNHDVVIGSMKDNLELYEDNIGLYARATVTDETVLEKARNGELKGWSFGFSTNKDSWEDVSDNLQRRTLEDINLSEVSILTLNPAYIATSIEMRGEECHVKETRGKEEENEIVDNRKEEIDYTYYKEELDYLKLKYKK